MYLFYQRSTDFWFLQFCQLGSFSIHMALRNLKLPGEIYKINRKSQVSYSGFIYVTH